MENFTTNEGFAQDNLVHTSESLGDTDNAQESSGVDSKKLSRQARRRQKRMEEKRAKQATLLQKRADEVLETQSAVIKNSSSLTDDEKQQFLRLLLTAIDSQCKTDDCTQIKGLPDAFFAMLNAREEAHAEAARNAIDQGKLYIPSELEGFNCRKTIVAEIQEQEVVIFQGELMLAEQDRLCKNCGVKMTSKGSAVQKMVKHVPIGNMPSCLLCDVPKLRCPNCRHSFTPQFKFQSEDHRITKELEQFAIKLLAHGFTLQDVAQITGLGKNVVKEIDFKRLKSLYTDKDGKLIKPGRMTSYIAIDEFKLHNGRRYATIIIDLETGEALWMEPTKKKQVVYDFCDHVGDKWMMNVKAVACDMNADFKSAFLERFPHLKIVFDHFHIVKHLNEDLINQVRLDECSRLMSEKRYAEARRLKYSKYILTASKERLKDLDQKAGQVRRKESTIFNSPEVKHKGGKLAKYEALIKENELLLLCDIIKEKLAAAYRYVGGKVSDRLQMGRILHSIIRICKETENKHFLKFSRMIERHYYGIISHATYPITSGKMEGINQKIKTVRREAYGLPDDEYFFLKIMDFTRHNYGDNRREGILKKDILNNKSVIAEMMKAS